MPIRSRSLSEPPPGARKSLCPALGFDVRCDRAGVEILAPQLDIDGQDARGRVTAGHDGGVGRQQLAHRSRAIFGSPVSSAFFLAAASPSARMATSEVTGSTSLSNATIPISAWSDFAVACNEDTRRSTCREGSKHVDSEISGHQLIKPFAAASVNLHRHGVYQVPVRSKALRSPASSDCTPG